MHRMKRQSQMKSGGAILLLETNGLHCFFNGRKRVIRQRYSQSQHDTIFSDFFMMLSVCFFCFLSAGIIRSMLQIVFFYIINTCDRMESTVIIYSAKAYVRFHERQIADTLFSFSLYPAAFFTFCARFRRILSVL